jgi:hypothetical protein
VGLRSLQPQQQQLAVPLGGTSVLPGYPLVWDTPQMPLLLLLVVLVVLVS